MAASLCDVILCDDDDLLRQVAGDLLADAGCSVRSTHDGVRLLDALDRSEADVVVLDVGLTGMGGAEVAERVTRTHPDVRIVVLSAFTRCAEVHAIPADAVLDKSQLLRLPEVVQGVTGRQLAGV